MIDSKPISFKNLIGFCSYFSTMPLFQQSVLKKYISDLDSGAVQAAWVAFSQHFLDPVKQENIGNLKEEEYQEGFVRDLFVNVLGYTLNPQPDFNFVLEKKTVTDATKSDGAIIINKEVVAVIELKDTGTADLDKVSTQAFGYKHKHRNCVYVVTSNFEQLRFYINDQTEHEEFNLFALTKERFAVLYLCLQQSNISRNVPLQMKQQSLAQEENITRKLYNDYSLFKRSLFQNIAQQNPQYDKLLLFKKTQKLLDRFLFIFFAEDRLLLPPNSIREILNQWQQLKDLDNYVPLYDRFRKYFGYLHTGHMGKHHEIFAYNGGLFLPDEVLDTITIDDNILYEGTKTLSNYDFDTEVDVNILGHIFEHSLTEIEELQTELEGKPLEKNKTKRKKEGVFYTPRYITKYIVENTVGMLCNEQKAALQINDETFAPQKRKANKKVLLQKVETYRNWLLQLTICDPACGSGAFLNAALEYLVAEHRTLDELTARMLGEPIVYPDIDNIILEQNIFGVDINEDAIDIAKLSLWLHTAKKGRKLSNLSGNILCGNSLISDPAVAGEKAFDWQASFKAVFDKGGFDVVIGNPPYVDIKALNKDIVTHYFNEFSTANNRINLFAIFIEKSLSILDDRSCMSLIIPSSLLTQESYLGLRKLLLNTTHLKSIVRLPNESFGGSAGEVKVDTIILTLQKENNSDALIDVIVYKGFERVNEIAPHNAYRHLTIPQQSWRNSDSFVFRINTNDGIDAILEKMEQGTERFEDCSSFCLGLTPYDKYKGHSADQIINRVFHSNYKKDETFKKLLAGNDVTRYNVKWNGEEWISYGKWLGAPRENKFFIEKRILVKQIIDWSSKRIWAALATEELYNTQNAFNIIPNEDYLAEYLIALLNSKLFTFYHSKKFLEEYKDRFQKILIKECKELPIKRISRDKQEVFKMMIEQIISQTNEVLVQTSKFLKLLQTKFPTLTVNNKLQAWHTQSGSTFLKELEKQKIKLPLAEQQEWLEYFETEKAKAVGLQTMIDETDKAIDEMVYELYELTEEERAVVEG